MTNRKFHRTVFKVEVLSEDRIPDDCTLEHIAYQTNDGEWVGRKTRVESKVLTGKEAADALHKIGSCPSFFQLDDDGDDMA